MLGQGNEKSINKIQSILLSAKAKFVNKRAVGLTINFAQILRNSNHKHKTYVIVTSKDKCFNCHKMGYFERDYKFFYYKSKKKSSKISKIR